MVAPASIKPVVLMDADRIQRSIRRIAYSLAEEYHGNALLLLGINTRGDALASRLHDVLKPILPHGCQYAQIVVDAGKIRTGADALGYDGKSVIVVDDVIFSGRTMQQAVAHIIQHGQPGLVRCVALVDRGHRKFPVEPQFTGFTCPTKLKEHVHVDLIPEAGIDQVLLYQSDEHLASE